ncbi:MAG: DUF6165 family protein [Rhodospirillaceae bacterium]
MPATLLAPVSWGDLIDRLTILEIKCEKISDPAKLDNVRTERDALAAVQATAVDSPPAGLADLTRDLKAVNKELWQIEDDIRDHEARQDFGSSFIALARAVYHTNDRRAALKKEVNLLMGSALVEEKSYADYSQAGS